MSKILEFRKKRSIRNDLLLSVLVGLIAGIVTSFFLPDIETFKMAGISSERTQAQDHTQTQAHTKTEGYLIGDATVMDGDSMKINGVRIRLFGIDAPELNQPCWNKNNVQYQCGRVAKRYLQRLINDQTVICTTLSRDDYGREISKCINNENIDMNAKMVSSGNAIAYLHYSNDYAAQQEAAQNDNRGIWVGHFTDPYRYRKMNK